jgi:hypothetical protein
MVLFCGLWSLLKVGKWLLLLVVVVLVLELGSFGAGCGILVAVAN